jgi:histidyl-tRNA synthetase
VGAGGRYDGLIAQLDGPPLSGIGFACGVERLALAMEAAAGTTESDAAREVAPDVFVAPIGGSAEREALSVARRLRRAGLRVELGGGRSLKSQMRRADRLGASRVLILGDEEIAARRGTLRDMLLKRTTSSRWTST